MRDRNFLTPIHVLQEVAESIPTEMVLILKGIGDGEWVYPLSMVAESINMDPTFVHKTVKIMKAKGLVIYAHLKREDEDLLCGSGYFRSVLGDEALEYIESLQPDVQPISGPH